MPAGIYKRPETKIEIICKYCNKKVKKHSYQIKNSKNKYCSQKCHYLDKRKKIKKICLICKNEFKTTPSRIKYGYGKYCSKKCRGLDKRGNNHPKWKADKYINNDGYIQIRNNGKPILEHRFIWEKYFGKLKEGIIIHHLNGNRSDNRIDNLMAIPKKNHSFMKIIEPFRKRIIELENIIKNTNKQKNIF